ncbi:hypothetical protein KIPB_015819, partial [Kipferlia bialata]|eukprot:g15819.t1
MGVRSCTVGEDGKEVYGDTYEYRSYTQMGAETDEITKVLSTLGVSKGDRVALFAMNKP